jgi:hypothetical protein
MIGLHVSYSDAQGNTKGAVITAVRDAAARKVRLAVLSENATWSDVDNVVYAAAGAPNSWRGWGG